MDWFDLLAAKGTLKGLLQYHNSKTSILQHSAFFILQLSHPYMTNGKTIALTRKNFVGKVMSLLFNMLSRMVSFPQFVVIHTDKSFGVVDKAEVEVFLELPCFFHDPMDVGNLISVLLPFLKPA